MERGTPLRGGTGFLRLLILAPLTANAAGLQRFEAVESHMGALVRIRVYAPGAVAARRGFAAAFARIREIDERLSDYKPTSELMRLATGSQAVSSDLFRVIGTAQRVSEITGGAFDVTVGPLVALWRKARETRRLPSDADIETARTHTGYRGLKLQRGRGVELAVPGMKLDLGGIAKGFAAHEAVIALRKAGLPRALVAISGDIALGDPPPSRDGWLIDAGGRTHTLRNTCVSTSGDREQFVEIGGVRYSHIIDPRTGIGVRESREVSIIARDGAVADALATACSIVECRPEWLRKLNAQSAN